MALNINMELLRLRRCAVKISVYGNTTDDARLNLLLMRMRVEYSYDHRSINSIIGGLDFYFCVRSAALKSNHPTPEQREDATDDNILKILEQYSDLYFLTRTDALRQDKNADPAVIAAKCSEFAARCIYVHVCGQLNVSDRVRIHVILMHVQDAHDYAPEHMKLIWQKLEMFLDHKYDAEFSQNETPEHPKQSVGETGQSKPLPSKGAAASGTIKCEDTTETATWATHADDTPNYTQALPGLRNMFGLAMGCKNKPAGAGQDESATTNAIGAGKTGVGKSAVVTEPSAVVND